MGALQDIKNAAALSFNPRRLKLTLLPTEQCNFRCRYCYEDFKIGKMTPRVIGAVKSLLQNRVEDLDRLEIAWFGGEPLVARDIVTDIQGHAFRLCSENNVSLDGSMTTNGYLLDEHLLQKLVAIGIRQFQISLDGGEQEHNKNRVLASGAGTFERIWRNLEAAAATNLPFQIILRIHITAQNINTVEAFVEDCREAFANDRRFSFFFKQIVNLGGSSHVKSIMPERDSGAAVYERLLAVNAGQAVGHGFETCYAAQPNAFVVRADGRLARCTVAFNADNNNVGALSDDGKMDLDIEKLNLWFEGFATLDVDSLSCPLSALKLF